VFLVLAQVAGAPQRLRNLGELHVDRLTSLPNQGIRG
jgi:hypothetical protein